MKGLKIMNNDVTDRLKSFSEQFTYQDTKEKKENNTFKKVNNKSLIAHMYANYDTKFINYLKEDTEAFKVTLKNAKRAENAQSYLKILLDNLYIKWEAKINRPSSTAKNILDNKIKKLENEKPLRKYSRKKIRIEVCLDENSAKLLFGMKSITKKYSNEILIAGLQKLVGEIGSEPYEKLLNLGQEEYLEKKNRQM